MSAMTEPKVVVSAQIPREQREKLERMASDDDRTNFGSSVTSSRDTRTGTKYRRYRGEVMDAMDTPIVAWAITPDGPLFLEPA